ncbi:MAG TPA: hypothetical protein VGR27_13115 [Longimicrobiaceae bacterium]|nr:hypothetical protein [Longimicrobiaceae bacterium]
MQRFLVCLVALLLLGTHTLEAQQRCRNSCDRERDRTRVRVVTTSERARVAPRARTPSAEFGVRGGYDFDDEVASAGAQLRIPLTREIHLIPSGDVFLDDAPTQWQLNADAVFRPEGLGGLYGGGGLAFASRDFDEDADGERESRSGFNLLVGLDGGWLGGATVRPFVEARWTNIDDYRPFRVVLGVNVPIRR